MTIRGGSTVLAFKKVMSHCHSKIVQNQGSTFAPMNTNFTLDRMTRLNTSCIYGALFYHV